MDREIQLSNGGVAIVDADDYERINRWRWARSPNGYAGRTATGGKKVLMHRQILGAKEGDEVDHINREKLDNRRSNLRFVTRSQNMHNRPRQKNNTSGAKGVSHDPTHRGKKKWRASIQVNGRYKLVGRFVTMEEAVAAYDDAARAMVGEAAMVNREVRD